MHEHADIAVIGAGAAGLFASIWAARAARDAGTPLRVLALDGAAKLGAKILVAGGGRCNVTHHAVDESAYAGSSRNAIKKVLRRFDVPDTVAFFESLGVTLKREPTGKLFPTSDSARTVLDALLRAADDARVSLLHPWRVHDVTREGDRFTITRDPDAPSAHGSPDRLTARAVILATGGLSLPKTGSDGRGLAIAASLGHTLTPRLFPALVPLTLPKDHWVCSLAGITLNATLTLASGSGKRLARFTNSTLCTHFGLSGPAVLDISRYFTAAKADDAGARLSISWLPDHTFESADAALQSLGRVSPGRWLREQGLPDRLALALSHAVHLDPSAQAHTLTRDQRKTLSQMITDTPLPVSGDRGFLFAEVTAGGVPLAQLHLDSMMSRTTPNLFLCGEVCDVDGRIGGFNFQWAWASGFVAGAAAARRLLSPDVPTPRDTPR
ncbi:MAG: NAD(P)/FAD-dependent oxidoreductase [Phycisphaeraceae bacterium]|nr:MAG: NAD(P)/FAD-dependent oxidoreductase [Phycisphaeraceae bacterium]